MLRRAATVPIFPRGSAKPSCLYFANLPTDGALQQSLAVAQIAELFTAV